MTFHVGQKVVCVDADNSHIPDSRKPQNLLVSGVVYTVAATTSHKGQGALRLQETGYPDGTPFFAFRFRPVVERKTDISVFNEILRKATRRIDA